MNYQYQTNGTCSQRISFEINDGVVSGVQFLGGCDGNLQAVSKLVNGMHADEIEKRLKGIDCCGKGTSCPDQFARAVHKAAEKEKQQ